MSTITPEFLKQKAREISYALNRVSFYIKREELRNRLERLSFEFLENVAVAVAEEDVSDLRFIGGLGEASKQSLIKVFKNISALDVLVRVGYSLYEIETVNSNILIKELDSFNLAIRQLAKENSAPHCGVGESLSIESIFSTPPVIIRQPVEVNNSVPTEGRGSAIPKESGQFGNNSATAESKDLASLVKEKEIVGRVYSPAGNEDDNSKVAGNGGNSAIRQNLISERIRQSGKTNVKELTSQFPGVSERTLRYDLQRLCDWGMVEKVGNSGPGTSYIPKKFEPINLPG